MPSPWSMTSARRVGMAAAIVAAPVGLAYRFALAYRARAGFPRRFVPTITPADLGMPFESLTVQAGDVTLPAWFIPARDGAPGPGVALVHGWESARDRTLPNAVFLRAAGFHTLTIDVRGHGANSAESLPVSAGEFGMDAGAAFDALMSRPEVTVGGIVGHSMGAIGAILASAADPRVAAVVATSSPAGPYRLTRQTFRLAHLPIPDPIAFPLAWLTTRVYLRPRGHGVADVSATRAIARFRGPILLAHGSDDGVVPLAHMERLAKAARAGRETARDGRDGRHGQAPGPVETFVVAGGQHSWLYEDPGYRRVVARFLAEALGGPMSPEDAGAIAAATPTSRIPDGEAKFSAVSETQSGFRTLAQVALPGATRARIDAGVQGAGAVEAGAPDEPGLG